MGEKIAIQPDPAASTEHLTSGGKRRHKRVNRGEQIRKYELVEELRVNELIDAKLPPPGQNLKQKERKIMGQNTD